MESLNDRVPDKIRNNLLHVQFRSSAQSPDLSGPFAKSCNVSRCSWRKSHLLRYLRIFPHATKLRSPVQRALSCCTLVKTTTSHSILLSSALILSFYLNLCFEAVALRQVFLPKTCKLSLCPILLIWLYPTLRP